MVGSEEKKFEELLELPKSMGISDFDNYINEYLKRKADKNLAIQELDRILAVLQNHITSLSLYLTQTVPAPKPHKFHCSQTPKTGIFIHRYQYSYSL